MRQLGAIWWENRQQWAYKQIGDSVEPHPDNPFIKIGWPAGGGAWVLNITLDEAITRGAGIIYNDNDMEH